MFSWKDGAPSEKQTVTEREQNSQGTKSLGITKGSHPSDIFANVPFSKKKNKEFQIKIDDPGVVGPENNISRIFERTSLSPLPLEIFESKTQSITCQELIISTFYDHIQHFFANDQLAVAGEHICDSCKRFPPRCTDGNSLIINQHEVCGMKSDFYYLCGETFSRPPSMEPAIFLIGGHDLEMSTIKQLLEGREDCVLLDRNLRWDNAYLSAYREDLCLSSTPDIYGIELKEDIPVPRRYHRIDHHNDWSDKPSSLEQVASVLNVQLNRYQLLVAANDKGYIPAMRALEATEEEIAYIRRQDRVAQGVTDEDEALAKVSVTRNLSSVNETLIVKSLTPRFSAICDRLFPYRRLLIYTDAEWAFYGDGKESLVKEFARDIAAGRVYYGGGPNGYIGAVHSAFSPKEITDFVTSIKQRYG